MVGEVIGPTYRGRVRKASAPMLFLVGLLVVAVLGGATLGIASLAGLGDDDSEATSTTSSTVTGPTLAANQVAITGTATNLSILGAVVDQIIAPTITTPSAGLGAGANIAGALVDGEASTIVWDAGRPLAFAPSTPLRLQPAPVNLTVGPDSITVGFPDDSVHRVEAGEYEIDAPVAVSAGELAETMDRVAFTAIQGTTVAFTGGATASILPITMTARGPGQVGMEGALQVRRPDGTVTPATQIGLPGGSYEITFTPNADGTGYDLSGVILEGDVVVV
jgi:hypothetical protein